MIDTPRPPSSPCSRAAHDCIAGTTRRDVSFRFVSFPFVSFRFVSFDRSGAASRRGRGEEEERFLPRLRVFGVINKIVTRRQETNFTDRDGESWRRVVQLATFTPSFLLVNIIVRVS